MRSWRAHLDGADPGRAPWALSPEDSAHLTRVLRLRVGDSVGVFDGRGREWDAEILEAARDRVVVRPVRRREDRVDPVLPVVLHQARCRPDRFEWVLQKGTEIGVARFVPVRTARAEGAGRPVRRQRLERILVEACKQCGRRTVPLLDDERDLDDDIPDRDASAVVLAGPGAPPIGRVLAGGDPPPAVEILVGPEGGLEPDELEALEGRGWRPASLGPRTLRTETAGLVAAALTLHLAGDLGRADDR